MSGSATFPDWATPGAGVLVVKTRYSTKTVQAGKIERLTKTRIVVAVDTGARQYELQFVPNKFNEGQWSEYGRSSSWDIPAKLEPIDSKEAGALLLEQRFKHLESKALMACDAFRSGRTVEDAQATIDALKAYIDGRPE